MSLPRTDVVDVVVVGSGPVGSAFARVITEDAPGASVLLVEVGPALTEPAGRHLGNLPDSEAQADARHRAQGPYTVRVERDPLFFERARALEPGADPMLLERPGLFRIGDRARVAGEDGLPAAAMSSAVGGMGILWTASCPRPGDSERIPFIPAAEMDRALDRADRLLLVDHELNAEAPVNAIVRRQLGRLFDAETPEARPVRSLPLAVTLDEGQPRWSGVDVVLGDLLEGADDAFELRPGTLCRRVVMEGETAVGVELEDHETGERYVQPARHVFVAADAYRTPQLLFASGIRPPALGRYLNDHFQMIAALRLSDELQHEAGLDDPDAPEFPGVGGTWVPFVDGDRPFHGQILQVGASPAQLANRDTPLRGVVAMSWYATKEIRAEDRLEFSEEETDGYGMPAITVHYTVTQADRAALDSLAATMHRAAGVLGELAQPEPALMPGGVSMHVQGSTRMGATDDGRSVCDPVGRVWQTANVYVGGNNVIPTATAANPTITSVALAVRSAETVAAELRRGA